MSLCLLIAVSVLTSAIIAVPVSAAPEQYNFECYLGDTIDLHGVAYTSDRLYLFMTGPGLPPNGVTLTNPTLRADQGYFTTVDVASDQTWAMKWNTDRIRNQIKPGTYNVYVSTTATDLSGLAGGYKKLTVYLKDPGPRNDVSVYPGTYTLHPEEHIYTNIPSLAVTTVPTTINTIAPTPEPTAPVTFPSPTQKSGLSPFVVLVAVTAGVFLMVSDRLKKS
ncbi:hypothetical protein [uncultured Methanoregula sp.]|uniref:hypothetical protein n=1 Tax=uncultured Methanoregula sp. TaxID=1005933 RepID=UPI00374877CB